MSYRSNWGTGNAGDCLLCPQQGGTISGHSVARAGEWAQFSDTRQGALRAGPVGERSRLADTRQDKGAFSAECWIPNLQASEHVVQRRIQFCYGRRDHTYGFERILKYSMSSTALKFEPCTSAKLMF